MESAKRYRREVGGSGSGAGRGLHAEHLQHPGGIGGEFTQCGGDIAHVQEAQHTDGEVAQTGQCARGVAFSGAAAVFVKSAVAHVVQRLDPPVTAVQFQQLFGGGLGAGEAADEIDRLQSGFVFADVQHLPLHARHLCGMGKAQIAVQHRTAPDAAGLEAAMGFLLRGEVRCGGLKIEQVDVGFEGRLVPFDSEQVVRVFLLDDIARGVHLGMQSIEGEDPSGDVQGSEGRFDGGDFAPFGGDFHLI